MLGIPSVKSFFTSTHESVDKQTASSIDIIIYILGLASNSQLVEPYQERLREITAQIKPEEKTLSSENQSALADLYIDIEKYLIEKEPLKEITMAELRKNIVEKFDLYSNKETTFWGKLP